MRNLFGHYYLTRKPKLLKSFDKTVGLLRKEGESRYGKEMWKRLCREVRQEFEILIPQLPFVKHPVFRSFLIIAAQELALCRVFKRHGKTPSEAWEWCHEGIRQRLQTIPRWVRWLMEKYYFSGIVRGQARRMAEESQQSSMGKWAFSFVEGDSADFDFGVDCSDCSIHRFFQEQGGEEFTPYACLSDIPLSEALGWGLRRSETLADGCSRCNFRFQRGGQTDISSPNPEVQATIDRIKEKELSLG